MAGKGKILVEITGDSRKFKSALGSASRDADSFGHSMSRGAGKALKGLAVGVGIAGGALAVGFGAALKHSISDLNAHADASAQTNAALKSTGNAAQTTTPHIVKLADSIEKMSGMDDVAVQKGENMLLTFTNIRNGVGKNNQVFDQATRTLADMSVALGGDPQKNAIRLGKALNDPVKGITALTKVGVTFTDGQKKLIASLVKSGDTMGAQKVILKELNKEFGGSASAAGQTLTGKINILKARLEDFGDSIFKRVIPHLGDFVGWLDKIIRAPSISVAIKIAWSGITGIASDLWQKLSDAITGDSTKRILIGGSSVAFRNDGQGLASKFWEWTVTQIGTTPTRHVVVGGSIIEFKTDTTLRDRFTQWLAGEASKVNWSRVVQELMIGLPSTAADLSRSISRWATKGIEDGIRNMSLASASGALLNIGKLLAASVLAWGKFFLAPIRGILDVIAPQLLSGGERLAGQLANGIKTAPAKLVGLGGDLLNTITGIVTSVATTAYHLAVSIGARIADGVLQGITSLPGRLADKLKSYVSSAVDLAGKALPGSGPWHFTIHKIGEPMVEGILIGIANGTTSLRQQLITSIHSAVTDAKSSAMSVASDLGSTIGNAISAHAGAAIAALDDSPLGKNLAWITAKINANQDAEQTASLQQALADAQAGTTDSTTGVVTVDPRAVQSATQALDDWKLEQSRRSMAQQLQDAKDAIQKEADARTTAFSTGLANLQDSLNRGLISQKDYQAGVEKLLGASGETYKSIGDSLGSAYANGFIDQIKTLASNVSTILSGSYAIKIAKVKTAAGTAIHAAGGGFHGFASGGIVKGGRGGILGMIGEGSSDELIMPLDRMGKGGGGDVNITINGYVSDEHLEQMRNLLIRTGRRTTGGVLGGFA